MQEQNPALFEETLLMTLFTTSCLLYEGALGDVLFSCKDAEGLCGAADSLSCAC